MLKGSEHNTFSLYESQHPRMVSSPNITMHGVQTVEWLWLDIIDNMYIVHVDWQHGGGALVH